VRMGRKYVCAPVVSDDIEIPFGVKRLTQIAVNGEDALGVIERSRRSPTGDTMQAPPRPNTSTSWGSGKGKSFGKADAGMYWGR
jgi:hypothetical protein